MATPPAESATLMIPERAFQQTVPAVLRPAGWRFDPPERYQDYMKRYYGLITEADGVLLVVVLDLLGTVGHALPYNRVDVHLLRDGIRLATFTRRPDPGIRAC